MKIIADLHTHTLVSKHAFGTINEMVTAAIDKNLLALAITDHSPSSEDGGNIQYFKSIKYLPKNIEGLTLLPGSEINIINYDGKIDLDIKILNNLDFNIVSYHKNTIAPSSIEEHTNGYEEVIKNEYVDCLGHIGNPKYKFKMEYIIKLCKKYNKLIEINSSSPSSRVGSEPICKEVAELCKKFELNIVVTSDAHSPYQLGDFRDAINILKSVNFPDELVLNADYNRLIKYLNNRKRILNRENIVNKI